MFRQDIKLDGGVVQEYAIPLPFTLEQYRIGHDFAIVRSTQDEMQADATGQVLVELLDAAPTRHAQLGSGVVTRRRFHFGSRLPTILQNLLGGRKTLIIEEKASTYYPYVEAVYTCPLFGDRFAMTIQTVYCESAARMPPHLAAMLSLTRAIPSARRSPLVTIDICAPPKTSEGSLYEHVYQAAEDPLKHGLQSTWKPKMVSVKVVWVRLALPLVGPVLERKAIASSHDLYHRLHRRSYCWYHGDSGWGKMKSLDEVRALEKRAITATKIRSKLWLEGVAPPALYSFPPFYSRQRNQTIEKQRKEDWVQWIITWTKGRHVTELIVEKELKSDLFCNAAINRQLTLEDAVDVLDYMCQRGNGEWIGSGKDRFLVLYRSYAEWAKLVLDWVDSTGQMGGVLTVYELLEGDDTTGQDFHGIEQPLMLKILAYMEKQGNAKLFTGTDPSKMGVKIFKG